MFQFNPYYNKRKHEARYEWFTIAELIITMIIIGVIVAALSSLFVGIQRSQDQSVYKENATRAAQTEIESLRNNNYGALTPGENIDFSDDLSPKLPNGSTGTVVVTEPSAGLRRVDVTVSYPEGGQTHDVTLSSLIGVIGIAQ